MPGSVQQPLPPGGPGVLTRDAANGAASWEETAVLSNDTPLIASGSGAAGTSDEAARSDHVHPGDADAALWVPSSHGLKGWSDDPGAQVTTQPITQATAYLSRIRITEQQTLSNLHIFIWQSGSAYTGALALLYALDGTLIAQSASQNSAWTTNQEKTIALVAESGQSLTRSTDVIGGIITTTITGTFQCLGRNAGHANLLNRGLSSPALRYGTKAGGTPPSPLSGVSGSANTIWMGVS